MNTAPLEILSRHAFTALPLHDACHSGELERLHAQHLPPHTLMQRAGLAIARLALAVTPHAGRVEVVAGPGNNGGDGFEAARHLHRQGKAVRVWWFGSAGQQPVDAAESRRLAVDSGVEIRAIAADARDRSAQDAWAELQRVLRDAGSDTLVIDALLGRGLNRPARGPMADCIAAVNASAAPVLAVDLPSGLNGDTGFWPPQDGLAAAVVEADWTLALLSPAPGLFTGTGRDEAGAIWWHGLDVDLDAVPAQASLERGSALRQVAAPRRHAQHKGSFGDVRIVGGGRSMAGAAWLAARAALHCGAGRIHVDLLDPDARRTDALHPELMLGTTLDPARLAASTVVAGCGGGTEIGDRLPALLAHAARLVLDADALNALAADEDLDAALLERGRSGRPTVLTPHPLEAARLLACPVAEVQADRLGAARRLAERWQVVAVLKGSGTVIAAPGHLPSINASGNAALATPGSGDVLAGCLGGLWSRHAGSASRPQPDPSSALPLAREIALAACHLHGRTAQTMSPQAEALPASRLAEGLGNELRRSAGAHAD